MNTFSYHCSCGAGVRIGYNGKEAAEQAKRVIDDIAARHAEMGHKPCDPREAALARRRAEKGVSA